MNRFLSEPISVRNAASVIVTATFIVVVAGGIAIRVIDHREYSSIWEGMWWSLQTVTTVGYGDVTPKDAAGKIVGALVMLEGIAFLAIVTAAITSTFVTRAQREQKSGQPAEETVSGRTGRPSARTRSPRGLSESSRCCWSSRDGESIPTGPKIRIAPGAVTGFGRPWPSGYGPMARVRTFTPQSPQRVASAHK